MSVKRRFGSFFRRQRKRLWLDIGDPGVFLRPAGPLERYQDFGLGLLRTVMDRAGLRTDIASTRCVARVQDLGRGLRGYDAARHERAERRSFPMAREAAELFKVLNPRGRVVAGGVHASVAPAEMAASEAFDHICTRRRAREHHRAAGHRPRGVSAPCSGTGARSMDEWPDDRPGTVAESPPAGFPLAAGALLRVGAAARGHGAHEPLVSLAVRVLQRVGLRGPEHAAAQPRGRHRGIERTRPPVRPARRPW